MGNSERVKERQSWDLAMEESEDLVTDIFLLSSPLLHQSQPSNQTPKYMKEISIEKKSEGIQETDLGGKMESPVWVRISLAVEPLW